MTRFIVFAAACLGLTACDVRDVRDLNRIQNAGVTTQAAVTLNCDMTSEVCARTAREKARACLQLGQEAIASGQASSAAAREHARCAQDSYAAILSETQPVFAADAVGQMEAFRIVRETATSRSGGHTANQALAQAAIGFTRQEPSQAAGPYFTADSAYWRASFTTSSTAGCTDLDLAGTALSAAQGRARTPDFPDLSTAIRELSAQVARDADVKGCTE